MKNELFTAEFPSSQIRLASPKDLDYVGFQFIGHSGADNFFEVMCPCGVVAAYPLNKLPETNTPHPCGNPKHWTVRYD